MNDLLRRWCRRLGLIILVAFATASAEAEAGPGQATELAEATDLNEHAVSLYRQGQYADAVLLVERALAIDEKTLGPNHPHVATDLNNLAAFYMAQGQYGQAEPLVQRALAIREKALGPDHADVALNLNNLAMIYTAQGQYGRAEPLYQRTLALKEKALGPDHPGVALSLNNLAALYDSQGQYGRAEPLYRRALAIREKTLSSDDPDLAMSLNNLGTLYQAQGQYGRAETLHQQALAIREKALGLNHPDVANSLNNLAVLYNKQGQYGRAEALYQRTLAIREKALGLHHPDVASSLNNLAECLRAQGLFGRAEPLMQRALAIREKSLGNDHPDLARSLNSLAALYEAQGQHKQAEQFYQRALAIREKVLGPDHPDRASSLNNLAEVYRNQGHYTQAEQLYKRALASWEKALDPDHPNLATSLNNLAALYYNQRQFGKALDSIRKASHIWRERIFANSREPSRGADSERTGFRNTFDWHLAIAVGRLTESPSLRPELTAETFEIGQLFHDGPVGDALARMAARFAAGSGALADLAREKEDTLRAWQKADADLATAVGKPPAQRNAAAEQALRARAQELKERLATLNQRLAREYPEYAELTLPRPLTLEQARKLLRPGEALAVFALGGKYSFVWLVGPEGASFRRIDRSAADIERRVKTLRARLSLDENPSQEAFPVAEAQGLYQDLLGPETPRLAHVKTLFVVSDGALESLPFAVLVTEPPQGAATDYPRIAWLSRKLATVTLPTVSSLRALRTLAAKGTVARQPFIGFGDPDFGGGSDKARGAMTLALTRGTLADPAQLRAALPPLPETADELKAIARTLGAAPESVILGKKASVATLKATPLADYRVVGFATHALVAGEVAQYRLGEVEPAIVLTPPRVATAEDDGLLRASQAAQLKLNADWVVLSACNTAAPDGTPGAVGLSGLAKAFFYAGARALLVSHWKVLSEPATELTTGMFQEWQSHPEAGRAEALRRSMMDFLDHTTNPRYTHPMAWAPFVVAGEGGIGQ